MTSANSIEKWREECGVFGICGSSEASRLTYFGLYAQQHRGQESTGIVSNCQGKHISHKGMGLVGKVYKESDLNKLKGSMAMGHVRYSTTGESLIANTQPLTAALKNGPVAIAHNGNITNGRKIREDLISQGAIFQGTNDTEIILHLLARNKSNDLIRCMKKAMEILDGAFSIVCMSQGHMVAARDPLGFRPLVLGRLPQKSGKAAVVLASETCAFDLVGAQYVREIEPGEIFWVNETGEEHSESWAAPVNHKAKCIFEYVYFSRPDSHVFGANVYEVRKNMGRALARESVVEADMVIPVPDSGVPAAIGYSAESGIPFELGIIRNHYIGRTFIQPSPSIRAFDVKIKLNPQAEIIQGKKVIIVDDSLVRGTTSQKIIRLIRQAGAREIHFRIAAPPTMSSCYYGVDTPETEELIAKRKSREDICKFIGADSLVYLTRDGLMGAVVGTPKNPREAGFCAACFDEQYPTPIEGVHL